MQSTYYSLIAHGFGNGQRNWRAYSGSADLCRTLALASKTAQGKEDVRRIDIDRRWPAGFLKKVYRPDGTLVPNPKKP